jgi:hypothetical protein
MGDVRPFPRVRHRPFVLKHAGNVSAMGQAAGERYLRQQLDVQRQTMARRGIAWDLIEAEVRALESAIRAECWRLILTPGGAA